MSQVKKNQQDGAADPQDGTLPAMSLPFGQRVGQESVKRLMDECSLLFSLDTHLFVSRQFTRELESMTAAWMSDWAERERWQLVVWIYKRGGSASVRDVTHGVWMYRGKRHEVRAILNKLAEKSLGKWRCRRGPGRPSLRFVLTYSPLVENAQK